MAREMDASSMSGRASSVGTRLQKWSTKSCARVLGIIHRIKHSEKQRSGFVRACRSHASFKFHLLEVESMIPARLEDKLKALHCTIILINQSHTLIFSSSGW